MIQTANIGIGIQGKEGNQASAFSDYSIPSFQGMRRLILWHGRTFGYKSVVYVTLNLFKGHAFMVPYFFCNMVNGYSGLATNIAFYYALYTVMNTTFNVAFYMILDQDVSFNPAKFK